MAFTRAVGQITTGKCWSGWSGRMCRLSLLIAWPLRHTGSCAELERKGERLSDPDLMIAAIGLSRSLVVVTGNIKHFGRIEKLNVENWL